MAFIENKNFKIVIDPNSKKTQGLKEGDIVRRQYFDNQNLIYSLMAVIETGVDVINGGVSYYFIGTLLEGDEPKSGELLDFVRVTNLFDMDRSGALYLTASDSESPFMDVIDGLAYENSHFFPVRMVFNQEKPTISQYNILNNHLLDCEYKPQEIDNSRIVRMTKKSDIINEWLGIRQIFGNIPSYPERLVISFKIRASNSGTSNRIAIDVGEMETESHTEINIVRGWQYILLISTVDFPNIYDRSLVINLNNALKKKGDWCEIADFNVVELSTLTSFAEATKARIGKISGVVDPIFGVLEGYGAYFQNLYATKNVNIAGTLTAGDENGFSSTFYVGKIHKNVIQNSIDVGFSNGTVAEIKDKSPVGIGKIWMFNEDVSMKIQTKEWRKEHLEEFYCFSFWAKTEKDITVNVSLDENDIEDIHIPIKNEWTRYYFTCAIKESNALFVNVRFKSNASGLIVTSPQFEYGKTPSQNQPTDGTLSYVEDYGAWFNKGGIGGTIQNPLLKLNEDGSISSRDDSFVIKPDGTGHFASGRFEWSKETITLKDVDIKFEELSEETQEKLRPITIEISSKSGLTVKNNNNDVDATAVLIRNGKELDRTGVVYSYAWSLWNSNGTSIKKTYTGKSITVSRNDIIDKAVLTCEVSEK